MNQSHNKLNDELNKLNDEFSNLFNLAEQPILTKKQKKKIIKDITKSHWSFPKIAIIGFATAFATFAIVFTIAQISKPGDALYDFKIKPKATIEPTPVIIEELNKATQEVEQKQSAVQELLKQKAEPAIVKKAESELKKAQQLREQAKSKYEQYKNESNSNKKQENELKKETTEPTKTPEPSEPPSLDKDD